ncbi:MAG TPA: arginase family protein, partial [Thermomicrobiaceae bacterium]|nr:arginase family protein [Thermomicrobiaceae bacterium]
MAARQPVNRLIAAPVQPIQVPLNLGAARAGVEQGAAALDTALRQRWADDDARSQALRARLRPSEVIPVAPLVPGAPGSQPGGALYQAAIAEAAGRLAERVQAAIARSELPLALGGDHALSLGSIAGAARAAQR